MRKYLRIEGDNILDPCKRFPEGLKIGDRVKCDDISCLSTVIGKAEWFNSRPDAGKFTAGEFVCVKDDEPYQSSGHRHFKNEWCETKFVSRPEKQESTGQLLMF